MDDRQRCAAGSARVVDHEHRIQVLERQAADLIRALTESNARLNDTISELAERLANIEGRLVGYVFAAGALTSIGMVVMQTLLSGPR